MADEQTTNKALGKPVSLEQTVLTSAAAVTQSFKPLKAICAHLNAFHAYADEPLRAVETNHYCSHVNDDVRQCLLYDSAERGARLIGIEYMITPELYATLAPDEKPLWHSHVYEVKSGMLVMPNDVVPAAAWDAAEHREMGQVIGLYGKAYHLWQTDQGDQLPLGGPRLMTSFTADGQLDFARVEERDGRFGTEYRKKKAQRDDIEEPVVDSNADQAWKASGSQHVG